MNCCDNFLQFLCYLLICVFAPVDAYANTLCVHIFDVRRLAANCDPQTARTSEWNCVLMTISPLIFYCSRTSRERRPESCVDMSVTDMVVSVSAKHSLWAIEQWRLGIECLIDSKDANDLFHLVSFQANIVSILEVAVTLVACTIIASISTNTIQATSVNWEWEISIWTATINSVHQSIWINCGRLCQKTNVRNAVKAKMAKFQLLT